MIALPGRGQLQWAVVIDPFFVEKVMREKGGAYDLISVG